MRERGVPLVLRIESSAIDGLACYESVAVTLTEGCRVLVDYTARGDLPYIEALVASTLDTFNRIRKEGT